MTVVSTLVSLILSRRWLTSRDRTFSIPLQHNLGGEHVRILEHPHLQEKSRHIGVLADLIELMVELFAIHGVDEHAIDIDVDRQRTSSAAFLCCNLGKVMDRINGFNIAGARCDFIEVLSLAELHARSQEVAQV